PDALKKSWGRCVTYRLPRCNMTDMPQRPALSTLHFLQKTLWIDIDVELDAACAFRCGSKPTAHKGRQIKIPRRLDQQPKSVAAAQYRKRRFRRSENKPFVEARRQCGKPPRVALGSPALACRDDQAGQSTKGRIAGFFPHRDFICVERLPVCGDK